MSKCGKCDIGPKIKVSDYKYIGGSYGKCDEAKMMYELYSNGPLVASFEPDYAFMLYSTGIYHSVKEDTWLKKKVAKPEWTKVDHSVLLVGWGEERGQKYWLLQNTWGPSWGEDGYFRMVRGVDESGIESICLSATPYVE